MEIMLQDIQRLEQESGQAENDQRLRAIVAERVIAELEAKLKSLEAPAKES